MLNVIFNDDLFCKTFLMKVSKSKKMCVFPGMYQQVIRYFSIKLNIPNKYLRVVYFVSGNAFSSAKRAISPRGKYITKLLQFCFVGLA